MDIIHKVKIIPNKIRDVFDVISDDNRMIIKHKGTDKKTVLNLMDKIETKFIIQPMEGVIDNKLKILLYQLD